ncbi:MAG: ComEC/Rec2 family competence protein [Bacilli bacterium]|nr:ComEC/Rec2 family competence protein [Bacilli bacterium]
MILIVAIYLSLAILVFYKLSLIPLIVLFSFFLIFKKKKREVKVGIIIVILTFFLLSLKSKTIYQNIDGIFICYQSKTNYSLISNGKVNFLIYEPLNFLDIIHIKGVAYEIDGFDLNNRVNSFKDYLSFKGVYQSVKINTLDYLFKSPFKSFISHQIESEKILNYILFNDNNINDELYSKLKSLLLLPLFVVSGMHINFLYQFLNKYLKSRLSFIILLIYLTFLSFQLPALRAYLMLLFSYINQKCQLNIRNFDLFLLIYVLLLILNPLNLFNLSFLLTFVCSFLLFFLKGNKFKVSFLLNLGILPIIIYMNNKINLLGIVVSFFFGYFIKYFYLLSFVVYFLPIFDDLYLFIFKIITTIINYLNIFSFEIVIGKMSVIALIIYYFLYYLIIRYNELNIKRKIPYILTTSLLVSLSYRTMFFNYQSLVFLDVGQGNATLIIDGSEVTMIDVGGLKYEDIAKTRIIPYLESYGIKKINHIIISHNDFDHRGSLESLKTNYNIHNIYDNTLKELRLHNLTITNLNYQNHYDNENDNSGVYLFSFLNKNILIMSDVSKKVEEQLITKINRPIDLMLIGHHGSNSSSSLLFLSKIKPKLAIISVGKNNYGHPSKDTLETLDELRIPYYRIDYEGTLEYNRKNLLNFLIE